MDFVRIAYKFNKGMKLYYPEFLVNNSGTDLMIRGGGGGEKFYAIWDQEKGLWSTNEYDVRRLVDQEIRAAVQSDPAPENCRGLYLEEFGSKSWTEWKRYVKSLPDKWYELDSTVIFDNTTVTKESYASKKLPYPIAEGKFKAFNEVVSTLYSPEERQKIEWAIGAIIAGDSKWIQKFLVFYGPPGSGKSTVLDIVLMLFDGYSCTFEAKSLVSSSDQFALAAFKDNPLIAIQQDGDLSRIEDNTRLNSIISHERLLVNEKFKGQYELAFHSFLMLGTNTPVRITDAKSGIIRRLIDVYPSGDKIPTDRYFELLAQIKFELGAIAYHCLEVYESMGPHFYDTYVPVGMISATNDFFDFVEYHFDEYRENDHVSLDTAWRQYKEYVDFANIPYSLSHRKFKEELKNYFSEVRDRATIDGQSYSHLYSGFRADKFQTAVPQAKLTKKASWLDFDRRPSVFDILGQDYPAQYANDFGTPYKAWDNVKTCLKDIDTTKLHYCKMPLNHIVIDFDIKNKKGEKDILLNIRAAAKFPPTYAELSKSGQGIHLHYIYEGDPMQLSSIYDRDIEIKVFSGNQSLRRCLTQCNGLQIATINGGLPLKEVKKKMVDSDVLTNEKAIRTIILKNLRKEYHADTSSSINYIYDTLEKAYASQMSYDVRSMYNDVFIFASQSTHQADRCMKLVDKMRFCSKDFEEGFTDDPSMIIPADDRPICFFDVEVFPNLFLICYKFDGEDEVHSTVNPTPSECEKLLTYKLVGFNNVNYDNIMVYACMMGYNNEQLYKLSDRIIHDKSFKSFYEAKRASYTDIFDFSSKKQGLKKWEIELDIHHHELGLEWDKPVPEELWETVADYCKDDVLATEQLFHHLSTDWKARQILADLSGCTVNDSTNTHTKRMIFGKERNPGLCYTDLSTGKIFDEDNIEITKTHRYWPMLQAYWDKMNDGKPIKNSFPGYLFMRGKELRELGKRYLSDGELVDFKEDDMRVYNWYRDEVVGYGGYVYAEPGMYENVALLDIASMHPHSALAMLAFGPYTKQFENLVDARVHIKHKKYEKCAQMFDGKLMKYLNEPAEAKSLSTALKIPINSVYGLTSASFKNEFRDDRNKNNIVALRGALFMVNLKHEVQRRGFKVAHIKTDSIKIPNATPEIIQFVMDYGKEYGYTFEHEATYERMCLVNDAVYIARYKDGEHAGEWTATGTEFHVPYVFKTLFSHEQIEFKDLCETKSVTSALYLDMNEDLPEGEHNYKFVGKVGSFCPIKEGRGGGVLYRKAGEDKYAAATGTSGYRWLEAEEVRESGREDDIDERYYIRLAEKAKDHIGEFGSFDRFVSNEPLIEYMDFPPDEDLPF